MFAEARDGSSNPLRVTRDEMRKIGYRIVDTLVERFDALSRGDGPPIQIGKSEDLRALLCEPPPEHGRPFEEILDRLTKDVFPNGVHLAHPRFFAFISSPSNFIGAMADALSAGFNPFVGTWAGGSGPTQLELVVVDWLREMCGLPETGGGLFVSGGSMANLTGLATARIVKAREKTDDCVVYLGDQTHHSNERACRVLGFARSQMRVIPSTDRFTMDVGALANAMDSDVRAGRRPLCVVATAGTTNVGSVDPMPEIADLCARHDAWFHVDGAYGAAAMIVPRLAETMRGLGRADSLSLDPHKWLFQPIECGCLLVRDREHLRTAFKITPDYLKDVHELGELNLADHGIALTRSFRALKLWMTIQYFGLAKIREAIERGVEMAEFAEECLARSTNWEVVTRAQLAIVSFRYAAPGVDAPEADRICARLFTELVEDGFAALSSTVLSGRPALRFCTINPSTTRDDIVATIERLDKITSRMRDPR